MQKTCPKCGTTFECRHDQIRLCHCFGIGLTPAQRAYIKKYYKDCLCHPCLEEIKQQQSLD